eukprot:6214334-Pleurochrysis_carterae.AAC.2
MRASVRPCVHALWRVRVRLFDFSLALLPCVHVHLCVIVRAHMHGYVHIRTYAHACVRGRLLPDAVACGRAHLSELECKNVRTLSLSGEAPACGEGARRVSDVDSEGDRHDHRVDALLAACGGQARAANALLRRDRAVWRLVGGGDADGGGARDDPHHVAHPR